MSNFLDSLSPDVDRSGAAAFRARCRSQEFTKHTTGHCMEFVQTNVTFLPKEHALDFLLFCQRNPKPCPLLEVVTEGQYEASILAPGSDLRTDIPKYCVVEEGNVSRELEDIRDLWREDFYSFLLGCSFSFEELLIEAEIPMRHIDLGRNVSMYVTNVQTRPAGIFSGPLVVSMRPIPADLVQKAVQVTALMPGVHGAPIHTGDPSAIGIQDINKPEFGDPPVIHQGEVPVFWACGVTPMQVLKNVKIPFAITHSPGHMFITSKLNSEVKI